MKSFCLTKILFHILSLTVLPEAEVATMLSNVIVWAINTGIDSVALGNCMNKKK